MFSKNVKRYRRYLNDCLYSFKKRIPSFVSLAVCFGVYALATFYVFYLMYKAQPVSYIDEIFHVPQAKNYCVFNFTHWDPKITTLPGLYLYSVTLLSPVSYFLGENICNLFILRLVNVFTSLLTFYLVYLSFKQMYRNALVQHDVVLWSALNVASFPVLFFFNFLYYTDVVSVFFVLLTHYYHTRHKYFKSGVTSCLSVLMRQTNVVWVGFLILDVLNDHFHGLIGKTNMKIPLWRFISLTFSKLSKRKMTFFKTLLSAKGYILVCWAFLFFVYFNKGIVVGDRWSHQAVVHFPQLFYFSLFCTFLSFPFALKSIEPFFNYTLYRWKSMTFLLVSFLLIVHFNTLVHPYLLADNRHYTFYLWRLFDKFTILRYLLVPCYMFCIFNITYNLLHAKFAFPIVYWICVAALVIPQKLLELRYFILPYLFFRLNLKPVYRWQLFIESVLYLSINFLVIYIFVNKEFYWSDSADVQRIGW